LNKKKEKKTILDYFKSWTSCSVSSSTKCISSIIKRRSSENST